jgi:hypothetical protein
MAPPGHIRLFATTDDSALGRAACAYAKSLVRIAPVRLVTFTGTLEGPWRPFGELMATPMDGVGITCVAVDPSRWVWSLAIPMPTEDGGAQAIIADDNLGHLGAHEVQKAVAEIYSPGGRHVLFPIATPRDARQLRAAEKYEVIVVPSESHKAWWLAHSSKTVHVIPCMPHVLAHGCLRDVVLGETKEIPC